MAIVGTTQLATWLDTVFGPAAYGYFQKDLRLLNHCTDYSPMLPLGAKAIALPSVASRSPGLYTSEGSALTPVATTETAPTITINQFAIETFIFEDMAVLQSNPDVMAIYAQQSAELLRGKMQGYIVDSIITSATTNDVTMGSTDNQITFALLLSGLALLLNDNVTPEMCAVGLSGVSWGLSVSDWGDKYFSAAYTGGQTIATDGRIGQILGMPVYVTSDWGSAGTSGEECGSIWAKRAIAYATQGGIRSKMGTDLNQGLADTMGIGLYYGAVKYIDSGISNFTAV